MSLDKAFLKKLIADHNDPANKTRIYSLQGTNQSNIVIERIYNPDKSPFPKLTIVGEDLEWQILGGDYEIITERTALDSIDFVKYVKPEHYGKNALTTQFNSPGSYEPAF